MPLWKRICEATLGMVGKRGDQGRILCQSVEGGRKPLKKTHHAMALRKFLTSILPHAAP